MRARQIDKFDHGVIKFENANVTFNGHTRVVTNALLQAGQAVKERTLAGIGGTDNRNAGVSAPLYSYLIGGYSNF